MDLTSDAYCTEDVGFRSVPSPWRLFGIRSGARTNAGAEGQLRTHGENLADGTK